MTAPILNDRDLALQAAKYRSKQTNLTITGIASAFLESRNSNTILPATIVLTATPSGSVFSGSASYAWSYALSTAPSTWNPLGTAKTQTLNASDPWVRNASVQYRCIISENLLDDAYGYYTVTYSSEGAEPAVVTLSRTNALITCNPEGVPISFDNTGVSIIANRGSTSLVYSTNTSTPNSFTVSYAVSNLTDLTVNASPTISLDNKVWTLPAISAIAVDGAKITFTVTVYDASANPIATVFTRTVTYNKVNNGINNKSISISMYSWATSPPAYTAAFTYTWSSGAVSAYPSGWGPTVGTPTANGYSLYQRTVILSDVNAATTTDSNWDKSAINTIGYRIDGDIGKQGDSYRIAYIVTTSGTAPAQPGVTTGSTSIPSGWDPTPTANLTDGQYMYQSDGQYSAITTNITWGIPYLSNLKVGSLSALAASLGVVQIAASGSLYSGKSTFGSTSAGFFLGNDGGNAKFRIGTAVIDGVSNELGFDSSTGVLTLRGGSVLNAAGTALLSGTTVPADILNSSINISGKLDKSGAQTMTGPVSFNTAGAIVVGTLNVAGTTDNGLYLGNTGLVGRKAGVTTFSIDTDGTATFAGDISAASGAFSGTLSASNIITTDNIIDNAVTNIIGTYAAVAISYGAITNIISATIVSTGKPILIIVSALCNGGTTFTGGGQGGGYSPAASTIRVLRYDNANLVGANLYTARISGGVIIGQNEFTIDIAPTVFSYSYIDQPGAGNFTYHLQAQSAGSDAEATIRSMALVELKK